VLPISQGRRYVTRRHVGRRTAVLQSKQTQVPLHMINSMAETSAAGA
jgi:hypothetical protein